MAVPVAAWLPALAVLGLLAALALLEASLPALGLRSRAAAGDGYAARQQARLAADPRARRRAVASLRLLLLALLLAVATVPALTGRPAALLIAAAGLALLALLQGSGRLRRYGAAHPRLAGIAASVLAPFAPGRPPVRPDDGRDPGYPEDLADALATQPADRQRMVQALLELERRTVEDVMVPRSEVVGVDVSDDWESNLELLRRTPHTRLPLFDGDLDRVLGVVHMKRVANELAAGRLDRYRLREIALQREPLFAPEGTTLAAQLLRFRQLRRRIAFVVDEYGELLGLVTLEDILEEVVGEFTTAPTVLHRSIVAQPDGSYVVAGAATLRAVNAALGWSLPTGGPRTVGGLVTEYLETIPETGTSLKIGGHPIEVLQVADNAVRTIRIWPPPAAAGD